MGRLGALLRGLPGGLGLALAATALLLPRLAAAEDLAIDGVPVPSDVRIAEVQPGIAAEFQDFLGAWIGAWGHRNRHVLIVEDVASDGTARVVYAWADSGPTQRGWRRLTARIEGRALSLRDNFTAEYTLTGPDLAHGSWRRGDRRSETDLVKLPLTDLLEPGKIPPWPALDPAVSTRAPQQPADPGEALLAAEKTLGEGAYISRNVPRKGILLHLHGCSGFGRGGFSEAWLDTFEKAGFKVLVPNSFAEKRPDASCKTAPPYPDQVEINTLRLAQTQRVTELLQKAYPGVPIFVWGHSEGASLAYLLPFRYAGIIATGHVCGHRALATSKIAKDVPLLAIMGSDAQDIYLGMNIRAGRYGSLSNLCARVLQNTPGWRWVQVPDLAHFIPIWHPQVWSEVAKFAGLEGAYRGPDASAADKTGRVELQGSAREAFEGAYRAIKVHKAFAVGPEGTWSYSSSASALQDAKLDALYRCNRHLGVRFPANKCTLYAEGDGILVRK
mgnify:CR=1 FL=1